MERKFNIFPTKENADDLKNKIDTKKVLLVTTAAGIGAAFVLELIKTEASAQIISISKTYLPLIMK